LERFEKFEGFERLQISTNYQLPTTNFSMILAPLRGVTIRCFRETFADEIRAAGFDEAITPFVTATAGFDPMKDRELKEQVEGGRWEVEQRSVSNSTVQPSTSNLQPVLRVTPQFIGKDPAALRFCLERVKAAGYDTADLNCGCPFPMVRNKGRGSGLLRTPDVLRRMLEVGCEVMGDGKFSIKARLGVERNDELLTLMPMINCFPLRFLTVHARNAKQMYEGSCDRTAFEKVAAVAKVPLVYNGDAEMKFEKKVKVKGEGEQRNLSVLHSSLGIHNPSLTRKPAFLMIGRAFVRLLGEVENTDELLLRYLDASERELDGDRPVLGRMKELIAYWKELPAWRRRWNVVKLARTVAELRQVVAH